MNEIKSQIEVTDKVVEVASYISGSGLDYLRSSVNYLNKNLVFKPFRGNENEERSIRWRRTADEILKDGYVYSEKSCTDLVVTFQALCEAKGYKTNFVKVKGEKGIHSIAEVNINDKWYKIDVAGRGGMSEGKLDEGENFNGWFLWKRGRDAWDLGFQGYEDIHRVK